MDSREQELREQLRVLGTNFDALLKEMRAMPQPHVATYLGGDEWDCGNCYSMLEPEYVYCPWCGSKIIWEVDA